MQWWRYTRSREVKWPGWQIHRPGSALPVAFLFFSSENKNVTISNRFICFILTVKQSAALAACVLRATTKKRSSTFWGKRCIRWRGFRIFWPRNDLAPLLRWRLHLMTCLTTLVTWKWPGCLDVLAPPLAGPMHVCLKNILQSLLPVASLSDQMQTSML